jgi:nucleotide-binding universal stress UspA family protein
MTGHPKRLLIATDLSARCDRALDRAVSLAREWQARLVVLHVLEDPERSVLDITEQLPSWRRPPDPMSTTRRHLHADLGAIAGEATVLIERGDPAAEILRTAEAESCDLIVTGLARDELLGRFSLGRTVDRLLRRSRVPLLVVKDRPRGSYRHIVVATDFSASSRHALEAARHFFPQERLTIFHAYDAPMCGLMGDPASYQTEYREIAAQDCEAFLKSAYGSGADRQYPHVLIEHGAPDRLLRDYVRDREIDLVVLGSHGRSALLEVFIGSVAKQIMASLPCDALVVREPRAAVES